MGEQLPLCGTGLPPAAGIVLLIDAHVCANVDKQAGQVGTADQLIVLGTAAGDVKAHSAADGKLLWRASAVSEG